MTRVIAFALATTALAGCATSARRRAGAAAGDGRGRCPRTPPAPKPQYGSFGFDAAGMDRERRSGDNFYQFANGTWAKNTPIPADKSITARSTSSTISRASELAAIIEEQAKDPNSRIGKAYPSFMDKAAIEAKGLAPFDPWLGQVRGLKSKKASPQLYAEADRLSIDGPFRMFIGQDRQGV